MHPQYQYVEKALKHYTQKLEEETMRYGVLAISDAPVSHNAGQVVEDDAAGTIWSDISKKSGLYLHVDYVPEDPQSVYAILSSDRIPRPGELWKLWDVVRILADKQDNIDEKLVVIDIYAGPYKQTRFD